MGLEFAPSFFEGEKREGFYVQPLMKRVWAAQLEVLQEIDKICKRHDIKWFAEWGTLLGAVRHKGYIPWDDDVDIAMMREDYVRFQHYAKQEIPKGWRILDIKDENYDELLIRVVNATNITPQNEEFVKKFHGCPYCIGVDITCLDHIPKDKESEEVLLAWLKAANYIGKQWESDKVPMEEKWDVVGLLEESTGYHFDREASMKKQLLVFSDKISAMYYDDPESDEVTIMCLMVDNPGYRLPLSCYDVLIDMPFENITIPVPAQYDRVLRVRYGDDYMIPIREFDNGPHEYPYFKNQVEMLREAYEQYGLEFPEQFDWKE